MGVVRWLGKHFTEYKMPADFILLDDEQFELALSMRETHNHKLRKKKPKPTES